MPPWARIASVIPERYSFTTSTTRSGSSDSENVVNPRRSQNITVPTRLTAPIRRSSSTRSITSSTTWGGTKRANSERRWRRSRVTSA